MPAGSTHAQPLGDQAAVTTEDVRTAAPAVLHESPEPREIEELFLYAFATQAEVLHHVRTETVRQERERIPEILQTWTKLQVRVDQLAIRERGVADTIRTAPIPVEHRAYVDRVYAHPFFQKTFQHLPMSFEVVEIDKLVAPQRTVNLQHVQRLTASFPAKTSFEDLLRICLWPERSVEPIQHLEVGRNTHVFSSPMTDMRFLDTTARDITEEDLIHSESGGLPVRVVVAYVGYGCSTVNVFRVGSRLILNNGFHRVYALRALGITDIPVAVQYVHTHALEFPSDIMGIPSSYLLHSPRPVLMKDFFESGFTISLRVRERIRVVKVAVSASKYDVPT